MNTAKRTAVRVLSIAVAVAAGAGFNPWNLARASDPGREPPSVKVLVRDLDLRTPVGVATLYARIRNAARSVCGDVDIRLLEERQGWDRCVDQAIGDAVARVGSARLTDYYLAKTHRAHAVATAQILKPVDPVR